MPNEVKESYSNLVNALHVYTIAALMWTKMCRHKATLCLQVGNMLPVSNKFCSKGFAIHTKPEFRRTHTCTLCVLSTAVLCREQHHYTAVNGFTCICDCPSGGCDNTPTNQLIIIITRGHWRPCCDNRKAHI